MPQPKRAAAAPDEKPQQTAREYLDAQYISYREEAAKLWEADPEGKKGVLSMPLFMKLEPLLFKPTPSAYIETIQPVQGKPYESTGLKSTQVQYDRMNDVLSSAHWRILFYYTQQGTVCKAVGIVGNDLQWARLDDSGELLPYTVIAMEGMEPVVKEADIVSVREGWGGWKSKTVGDTLKASETNACKRMLSRFGPGSDVYRGELEADIVTALKGEEAPETTFSQQATGRASAPPRQQRPQGQQQQAPAAPQPPSAPPAEPPPAPAPEVPQVSKEEAEKLIADLLTEDASVDFEGQPVDLKALRTAAVEAITKLPEDMRPSAPALWTMLQPRKDDPRQLGDLITRAQNAAPAA